jgi:hypothetical protein
VVAVVMLVVQMMVVDIVDIVAIVMVAVGGIVGDVAVVAIVGYDIVAIGRGERYPVEKNYYVLVIVMVDVIDMGLDYNQSPVENHQIVHYQNPYLHHQYYAGIVDS